MKKVFLVFAILLLFSNGTAFSSIRPIYGSESAALNDDATSLFLNPAGIGARYGSNLIFNLIKPEVGPDEYALLTNLGGLGFGVIGNEDGVTTTKVAMRFLGAEKLRMGAGLTWQKDLATGKESRAAWDLGILSRPCSFASLGLVGRNLNKPTFLGLALKREYQAGFGVRPLTNRVSFFVDATLLEKKSLNKARLGYGLEGEPIDGVLLRAGLDSDGNVTVGAGFNFMKRTLNFASSFDNDRDLTVSSYTVTLNDYVNRTVATGKGRIAEIPISGSLADETAGGGLLGGGAQSTKKIRESFKKAAKDPQVKGVILRISGVSGNATIEELKKEIKKVKEKGKPVLAFLEYGGGRGDIYLAASADKIVTTEEAYFGGLGIRREVRLYRKMLANFGIEFDRFSHGKYKSAFRNYTVDEVPEADKEVINSVMDESQSLYVETVHTERKLNKENLEPVLQGQPLTSVEMMQAGLVDSIGYYDKALRMIGNLAKLGSKPGVIRLGRREYRQYEWAIPKKIAILYASGTITTGRSSSDFLFGSTMGSETVVAQLKKASSMKSVKGIVLRVESRGGDGLASNLIWNEVRKIKEETKKPIVVSMGQVAASGGYYISCPATKIFADKNTVTGSIGVLTLKPSIGGLYGKLDVKEEDFERGKYMGMYSGSRKWNNEEFSLVKKSILDFYDKFLVKVAQGRGMSKEKVDEVAQGRVWLGTQAKPIGLIDEIGGLEEAIKETKKLAGIKEGEEVYFVEFRRPRPPLFPMMMTRVVDELKESYFAEAMDSTPQYLLDWDLIWGD